MLINCFGKQEIAINMSFLGHSDIRLDLDKDIKLEDARYYPALSIMASKLAYENEAFIKSAVTNRWEVSA